MTIIDVDSLLARSHLLRRLPEPAIRRLLRERAGLSQAEIAEALGVTSSAVSRWETGRRMPRGARGSAYAELLERLTAVR